MSKENPTRNNIRDLTLGRPRQFRRKTVNYYPLIYKEVAKEDGTSEWEVTGKEEKPIQVEVRQPTVKERNEMVKMCQDENGVIDQMQFIIQAAIHLVYDPESGERVYSKHDYDALVNQPTGSFLDQFGEKAIEMLTIGQGEVGNEKTLTDSSSEISTPKESTSLQNHSESSHMR